MYYGNYLVHFNDNHSSKNGQFIRGDGDNDGQIDERHRYTKRELKNKKRVNSEIAYQNKKISNLKSRKQEYDNSIAELKKSGMKSLLDAGYSKSTAQQAVDKVVKDRQTESDWLDYQIKNMEKYNATIADLDVSNMTSFQVEAYFRTVGNKTLSDINKFDSIYKGKTLDV